MTMAIGILLLISINLAVGVLGAWPADSPLIVNQAPNSPRPYVIPHLGGAGINFNGQILRLLVSNESSGGALTFVGSNSGFTVPVVIHNHKEIESYYGTNRPPPHLSLCCSDTRALAVTKGSVDLFANADLGRTGFQNDFHVLSPGTNHTYRFRDYDSEVISGVQPGGIEKFLQAVSGPYETTTNAPFDPFTATPVNSTASLILAPRYSVGLAPFNTVNTDFLNDTTADGRATWHRTNQTLPGAQVPYFLSSNMGPKFLARGLSQVVLPLATAAETGGRALIATVNMRATQQRRPETRVFRDNQLFRVLEGQLTLSMAGSTVNLIPGDTAWVPAGTRLQYSSSVAWTKFYAYATGQDCLVAALLRQAEPWVATTFPAK